MMSCRLSGVMFKFPQPMHHLYLRTTFFLIVTILPLDIFMARCEEELLYINPCLHDGITKPADMENEATCECRAGYEGPRCEITSASFSGIGYAWYPPLPMHTIAVLEVQFVTANKNGLILFNEQNLNISDFISLELREGKPLLLMDYGDGVTRVELKNSPDLHDSKQHHISIQWRYKNISMRVNDCQQNDSTCYTGDVHTVGRHNQLNVDGPLQVGGRLSSSLAAQNNSTTTPTLTNFTGCISNLTYNGKYYDLGNPTYAHNMNATRCDQHSIQSEHKSSQKHVQQPLCAHVSCNQHGICTTTQVLCEENGDQCVQDSGRTPCFGEPEVPVFPLQNSNATIPPLETVKIVCNVPDYKNPSIDWTWEKQPIANWGSIFNYSFVEDKSTLAMKFLTEKVKGRIQCTSFVTGKPKISIYMDIVVADYKEPSFVATNLDNSTQVLKKYLKLICVANGTETKTTWIWALLEEDNNVPKNRSTSSVDVVSYSLGFNNQSLNITNISTAEKVRFICIAENEKGRIMEYVDVSNAEDEPIHVYETLIISGITVLGILALVLGIALVVVFKYNSRRKVHGFTRGLSMTDIYKDAIENLNPDLDVKDQAYLLPFSQETWEISKDCLKLGKILGSGAFGVVRKAEAVGVVDGETKTTVAVKTVQPVADATHLKALVLELKIMAYLGKHFNVVSLIGAVTKDVSINNELFVVMEFCKFGSVLSYMHNNRELFINQLDPAADAIDPPISPRAGQNNNGNVEIKDVDKNGINSCEQDEDTQSSNDTDFADYKGDYAKTEAEPFQSTDLIKWAFQAAKGMEYLASKKVLHGDLAARNVLLAENYIVKICDFGFAREKNYDYEKNINGVMLPIKWMAIESINSGIFSSKSDCWSFGVLLWELFTLGDKPYSGMKVNENFVQRLKEGYRMSKPHYAPTSVYKIMLDCWAENANSRPQFSQVACRLKELISTPEYTTLVVDVEDKYSVSDSELDGNRNEDIPNRFENTEPDRYSISLNSQNVRYSSFLTGARV